MQRLIVLLCLMLLGCQAQQEDAPAAQVSGAASVVAVAVEQGEIYRAYRSIGNVAPVEYARIIPKVAGRVQSVSAEEGDAVTKGALLMQIDPIDYQRAYDNALATKRQAQVGFSKSKRDFANMERLYKKGSVSEQSYHDTRSALDLAQSQLDQALVGLKVAQQDLNECKVVSPIDGIVTLVSPHEGELVGQQIAFVVEDMHIVEVEVNLPEEAYGHLVSGSQGFVQVDARPSQKFAGTITKIYPTIDPLSRTFKVTISIDNPELLLRSGMTARTQVVRSARKDALHVPGRALLKDSEGYYLYRIEEGKALRTRVETGIEGDEVTEILAGLKLGDRVITVGQTGLRDGTAIIISD